MDAWKAFEQHAAWLFGVHRAWANSGERLDFPRPDQMEKSPVIGQCKNVKALSVNELTHLAEEVAGEGLKLEKLGVVCVKVRRGRGQSSRPLVVMTDEMWVWLLANAYLLADIKIRREHGKEDN